MAQAAGVRFALGVCEAGMMPGIAYYLSRWYRRSELAFRLSLYIVTAPLAGAFGGLLASGILKLSHFGGLHTWRMLFAIEGIITCCLAVVSYFTLTDRPATARWLTQAEKDLAIARVKSERVATTEVLDKLDTSKLLRGIFSPVTIGTAVIFLLNNITVQALAFFAPTIVKTIYPKASTISLQLHTVPPYVFGAFFVVFFSYLSSRYDRRNIFYILSAPLVMIGYTMFLASTSGSVRYGATFLIAAGAYSFGALCNAQVSANVVSDTARSAAIATNVMFGNVGGLIVRISFLLPFANTHANISPPVNVVLPAFRCAQLSHWQRPQLGNFFCHPYHLNLIARLDAFRQQEERREEYGRLACRLVRPVPERDPGFGLETSFFQVEAMILLFWYNRYEQ